MSTQQDMYAVGLENRHPMLNKDNYVLWSSRIIRYARSRPNGKMIVDSIENGPYVRRMIATPGEPDLPVPERVQQMMKGSDIGKQEKKAKLFNEWEKFTSTDGESIESYYHRFMQLMNDLKRNKHFPENIAANLKLLNNLQHEWKRHVTIVRNIKNLHEADFTQIYDFLKMNQDEQVQPSTIIKSELHAASNDSFEDINDPTKAMNAVLILFAKAFQLTAPTNNNQRTSSNPRKRQIDQPVMNMSQDRQTQNNRGIQVAQNAVQNAGVQNGGNQNGLVVIPGIANQNGTGNVVVARAEGTGNGNQARCYNCRGLGHIARNYTARPRRRDAAYLQTQILIAQKEDARIQLQAKEFDFMAAAGDLDEIEEINANCILMANLQHASTSGTQLDKAPVYDTDGSAEVNMVNCNTRATNAKLKSELARYKIQEQRVEISQEKYDKLEKCYQKSVYQEQCLTRKINALHLSSAKQITTLNDEISSLNKQLSKENSSISSLMEEKKKLKHDFKTREDKLFVKKVNLEAKIKDLENILLKKDQTVQTMHMLNPKPNSFYHPDQKMALGYPNPSYLKKAQLKQQSLYNGNLLLEEHDPHVVYNSEETLELAQESHEKIRILKKEIKPANYAKINHLSGVFVPQTTKSKEKLFLSNVSNMFTVSKMISIPNKDLSDDTTPSVARKFLNEVKSSLMTLQHVVKQKMTLEVHNWSSSAHKEVHKIISHKIAPIINQVDARVQNFEIQFLQEAAKFVRDFKSLAKEAVESLDKQKSLELEIKRLLKANVSHDIMSIVQNGFVDTSSIGGYSPKIIVDPVTDLPVLVLELFHKQTDKELTENDINRMDADDQAIQTILLGLPEDVYAIVDRCKIAKEIWERMRQMMKGSDIEEQEKKAKLFNEWEKFTSIDEESIESYYHHFMQIINDFKRNKHFPKNNATNLKFLNNLQPEWKRHVTIVRQTKNLHEADFTHIYDFLKMNQDENELVVVPGITDQNGTGNIVAARDENRRDLPKDTPIDRLEVLRYDIGKRSKVRMGILPTKMELTLEHTQQEHQSDIFVIVTVTMEILLEPTSNKLLVGDLGDSIWIELVTLDINLGPE
nr:hypothetical protein [Tanacetum cinerariifolium]